MARPASDVDALADAVIAVARDRTAAVIERLAVADGFGPAAEYRRWRALDEASAGEDPREQRLLAAGLLLAAAAEAAERVIDAEAGMPRPLIGGAE